MNALDGVEKEALRKELLDLGFDDVRFTDLSPSGWSQVTMRTWSG